MLAANMDSAPSGSAPGILCYDPNPTTAKLTTATLRLAGYEVFHAQTKDEAVEIGKAYGAEGAGSLVALLLDAAADPKISAAVLRALAQLPGAAELAGILVVSKKNPTPIPAAKDLPTVRRPFSSPALLKVVSETLASHDHRLPVMESEPSSGREQKLKDLLQRFLPDANVTNAAVTQLLTELDHEPELPTSGGDELLHTNLASVSLEALLEMLSSDSSTGVVEASHGEAWGRLHLHEGRIRLAEYGGDDEDLKLGRFIIEGGFMAEEELETFIVGKDPKGRPLGTRLVDGGLLSERDLAQVLVDQAREVTCQMLAWRTGEARFRRTATLHPMAQAAADAEGVELLIAEALLDGLRRIDEKAAMGPTQADVDDVFIRVDEQLAILGREALARDELQILELVNGRNSVKDIARRTRAGTFAVTRVLYRLTKSNVVRRRVTPVPV